MLYTEYPSGLLCLSLLLVGQTAGAHQGRHVSSVHLPRGDLLLRRGHGADVVGVRAADGAGPYYTWKCHRSVLHTTHPVELLLQNGRPCTGERERRRVSRLILFFLFLLPPWLEGNGLIAHPWAEQTDFWKRFHPNYFLGVGLAVNYTNCSRG